MTFQCKASIRTDWRSTSFYDQTYYNGVSSVAVFTNTTGACSVSSVLNKQYNASCDPSEGVFNLTIFSVDGSYHNQYIRCRVQFGNGISTDIYTAANSTIYVRINIASVIVTSNNITSDVDNYVNIKCNVTSRPAAIIKWLKTNSEGKISDITSSSMYTVSGGFAGETVSSVLTFKFTSLDNQGNVYCKAENAISTQNSSLISLNIIYPPTADPTIQQTPLGALVTGSRVVLTCTLSGGNPQATLLWNCSGNITKLIQGNTVFNSLTFIVDKNYHGKACSCLATHNLSSYRRIVQVQLVVNYPPDDTPSIIQTPVGAIITGTPVLLTCVLTGGNPVASLSWNCTGTVRLNSSETTASSSIEIIVNRQNHGVVCSCMATHSAGNYKQTAHKVMNVIYPPDDLPVIKQTQPGPIDTESTAILICSVAGGNPLPILSWDCAGITTNNASESTVIFSVEFTVDKNYNGRVCTCSASHRISTYRPTVQHKLIVYYPPTKPILKPDPGLAWFQGNITTIECITESGNPQSSYEWTRNSEKTTNYGNVLKLGPLTKEDNGVEVTCTVYNEYTVRKGIILKSDRITLDVVYFPDVLLDPSPVYAVEGDNITVTCNTTGNPTPKVQWLLDDKNITTGESTHSILKLIDIDRTLNISRYTCRAWAYSTKFGVLIKDNLLEIIVYYYPNITEIESLNGLIVPENQSATLQCHVDSNPLPNITWFFEENQEPLYFEKKINVANLTISRAQCYNTGIYHCVATNNINGRIVKVTRDLKLEIGCKPRVDVKHSSLPSVIALSENSELNISVNLIAYPAPVSRWILDKVIKTTDISKGIEHSSNLFIANVSKGSLGEYTIYSWNDYGHLFIHVRVAMRGPPNAPFDVAVVCKSQSITVLWKSGYNGGDKQSFYLMFWKSDDDLDKIKSDPLQDPDDTKIVEYVIKGVRPDTSYKIQVITSNTYGKAESQILECTTDSLYQLGQQSCSDGVNTAGIAMIITGAILAVFAILHYAWHCTQRRKENAKGDESDSSLQSSDENQNVDSLSRISGTSVKSFQTDFKDIPDSICDVPREPNKLNMNPSTISLKRNTETLYMDMDPNKEMGNGPETDSNDTIKHYTKESDQTYEDMTKGANYENTGGLRMNNCSRRSKHAYENMQAAGDDRNKSDA